MNNVVLIGRLTRDPDQRFTSSGVAVVNFTLAVDRRFKTDGEKKVDFIDIVAWRQLGELCANYLKKGREAAVQGRLEIETYEKDGQKRKSAKVIADNVQFIGGKGKPSDADDDPYMGEEIETF